MKNAMKKLMSLVLVAMILVSAVPFAASADSYAPISVAIYQTQADGSDLKAEASYPAGAERVALSEILVTYGITAKEFEGAWCTPEGGSKEYKKGIGEDIPAGSTLKIRKVAVAAEPAPEPDPDPVPTPETQAPVVEAIKIVVKNGSSSNVIWEGEKIPANGEYATVENLLGYCFNSDWDNVYTYEHGWSTEQQANVSLTGKIYAGDTLSVMLNEKSTSNDDNNDDDNSININTGSTSNEATGYTKFAYPVYLNIYTDTTVGSVKKTINITSGIAADGRVTLNEVKSLVANYYTAVKAATGIQYDGLYPAQGNWVFNYVADEKYDTIDGLYDAAADNYVYINVMISNAKALSSSTADSSNPKTGDEIYMAVTVMAVSASVLALGFFFSKKRAF